MMISDMPRVSVIIPSYNHAPYVRECVDSALSQTYPNVEVVVVDDGSTDGSADILRTYGDRIMLIEQENGGTQAARNAAIRASSGEYVALLDSDDAWLPHKLERQMSLFRIYPDTALVYSHAIVMSSTSELLDSARPMGKGLEPDTAFQGLLQGCQVPALTAVFRRDCLNTVGWFDESLIGAGDWDMWLKIARQFPVRFVDESLAKYRVHRTNTTNVLFASARILEEHGRVLQRYLESPGPREVSQAEADTARGRLAYIEAECNALAGDSKTAGQTLARAISLDPSILAEGDRLVGEIQHCCLQCAGAPAEPQVLDSVVQDMLGPSVDANLLSVAFRRSVSSRVHEANVYAAHANGYMSAVRGSALKASLCRPAWLLRWGSLSIACDAFLGPRASRSMRRFARAIRTCSLSHSGIAGDTPGVTR